MRGFGNHHSSKKQVSREKIVSYMQNQRPLSLRELSRNTGLNRPVVKKHVKDLLADGLLVAVGNKCVSKSSPWFVALSKIDTFADKYMFNLSRATREEIIEVGESLECAHVVKTNRIADFIEDYCRKKGEWFICHVLPDEYKQPREIEIGRKDFLSWYWSVSRLLRDPSLKQ